MGNTDPTPLVLAAQYVRMSTEHQNYSIEHQTAVLASYALEHGMEVVRTYADAGISGVRLDRRDGLKALLSDVLSGSAEYSVILDYDVSRWGRFQDPDESAHYEFLCKTAGVRVAYCAELFENDGSLTATLVKHLKRAMAAEYSRELSVKVARAKGRLAQKGFWQGGPPGYGLRRQVVHADGTPGPLLQGGQRKGFASDRVVLALGPREELETVRRIYRLFLINGLSGPSIARTLNAEGVGAERGQPWSAPRVRQILTNEKYAGVQVYGRTVVYLDGTPLRRPRDNWVRTEVAPPPIVSKEMFELAQRNTTNRFHRMSDAEMLRGLADLLARKGRLTAKLINEADHLPCAEIYRRRFGGLIAAYKEVGFKPDSRAYLASLALRKGMPCTRRNRPILLSPEEMILRLADLHRMTGRLSVQIIDDAANIPCASAYRKQFGKIINAYEQVGYVPTEKQRLSSEKKIGRFRDQRGPIPEIATRARALARKAAAVGDDAVK